MIKVSILGFGNVGRQLVNVFTKTNDIKLNQVYSRNTGTDKELYPEIQFVDDLTNLIETDVVFICLPDDLIHEFAKKINIADLVIHTSGTLNIDVLTKSSSKGVFYPVQTFTNKFVDFKNIPICIEASDQNSLSKLKILAKSISEKVYEIDSDQRKKLHLAAVFTNNFVNQMFQIGYEICSENDIPFEILYPLIDQTTEKIKTNVPKNIQTGPAQRNDQQTITKQLNQLNGDRKEIYNIITQSILNKQ